MKVLCAHWPTQHPCNHSSRCWLDGYSSSLKQMCYTIKQSEGLQYYFRTLIYTHKQTLLFQESYFLMIDQLCFWFNQDKIKIKNSQCLITIHRWSEIPCLCSCLLLPVVNEHVVSKCDVFVKMETTSPSYTKEIWS